MNIETIVKNDENYIGFKSYCTSLKVANLSDLDCRFRDLEQNNTNIEDKLLFAIESIKDFNINDVVHNYHCPHRYTTPLEFILSTENYKMIKSVLGKYINVIQKDIIVNDVQSFNLLTVLYSNLDYDNCVTDSITPLVFKFESLDFINVVGNFEQKLVILRYLINQKDNYQCNDDFLNSINSKYQEVLHEQEQFIFKKFTNYVEQTQSLVNNLISDLKYTPSEDMKEFYKLMKTLQQNATGDKK